MMSNQGISKLVEECGELGAEIGQLIQILGKKLARMETDEHWDKNIGSIKQRIGEEMGDVIGASRFVAEKLDMDLDAVASRAEKKYELFRQWDADPSN